MKTHTQISNEVIYDAALKKNPFPKMILSPQCSLIQDCNPFFGKLNAFVTIPLILSMTVLLVSSVGIVFQDIKKQISVFGDE